MCATKWNLPRFFPIYSPSYCTFSPPIEAKNEEKNILSFRMQNDSTWLFNWIHWNGRARDRGVCKPQSHQQQCVQHNQRRIVTNYHGCILLSSVLCLMYLSWCKTKHVTKLPPFGCWCCGLSHVYIFMQFYFYLQILLFTCTKLLYALYCKSKHFCSLYRFPAYLHANFHTTRCCSMFMSKI